MIRYGSPVVSATCLDIITAAPAISDRLLTVGMPCTIPCQKNVV